MMEKIIALGVWLIVAAVAILYCLYFNTLKTIGEILLFFLPLLIFVTAGLAIFSRDTKTVRKAKEKAEFHFNAQLNWGQSLKHDLITYFLPVVVLALPLIFGQTPNLTNVFQACLVFLALAYLKILYWGSL